MKEDFIGPVVAIGFPQGEAENGCANIQCAFDIVVMSKDENGYFIGLARVGDEKEHLYNCRKEKEWRPDNDTVKKYSRLRIDGNIETRHPDFCDTFMPAWKTLIESNRERGILKPKPDGSICEEKASVDGEYLGMSARFDFQFAEDFHAWWHLSEVKELPPYIYSKIGISFKTKGERTISPTQAKAMETLWMGMLKELKAERALILDWEKIPVNRALTNEELDGAGYNLETFAKSHFLDGAQTACPRFKKQSQAVEETPGFDF
jgi:hypothetical protein